jgi:membrane protein DedA with SNARE-associated domain
MNWDQLQQLIRIVIYAVVGYFFGEAVAQGEVAQGAIAGVIAVANFVWTYIWDKKRTE